MHTELPTGYRVTERRVDFDYEKDHDNPGLRHIKQPRNPCQMLRLSDVSTAG